MRDGRARERRLTLVRAQGYLNPTFRYQMAIALLLGIETGKCRLRGRGAGTKLANLIFSSFKFLSLSLHGNPHGLLMESQVVGSNRNRQIEDDCRSTKEW